MKKASKSKEFFQTGQFDEVKITESMRRTLQRSRHHMAEMLWGMMSDGEIKATTTVDKLITILRKELK
jgi:hypothetical protein